MTANARRNLLLLSGLLLSALAPFVGAGCAGDLGEAGGVDSGVDGAVAPQPDATPGQPDAPASPDARVEDGGGPAPDGGGNHPDGSAEAATDAGAPDAGGPDSSGSGFDAAAVPTDPIALWRFDEGSGIRAFDSSGHAHTATLFGGATFGPGKHGTGLSPNASGWATVPSTLPDAGITDAGAPGSDASDGGADASATDADTSDGGSPDADLADAGLSDAAPIDASAPDADAGGDVDAGPLFAPLAFDTTKSFSVVCWVKVYSQGTGQWQSIFSRDVRNLSAFTLKLRGDSPAPSGGERFDFDFPGADDTGTSIYTVAQSTTSPIVSVVSGGSDHWYHLAGVLDTGAADAGTATAAVRLYVNGALEAATSPGAAPILEGIGDTIIGASLFTGRGASWNGVIDDLALYDRALSAEEVAALYGTTK